MKGSLSMKIRAFHRHGRIRMKTKEIEKEVLELLPANKYLFLKDLSISESLLLDLTFLKNGLNKFIFRAIDLGRLQNEIKTLISAGDIIDNISDQLIRGGP